MPGDDEPLTIRLNPLALGLDSWLAATPRGGASMGGANGSARRALSQDRARHEEQVIADVMCLLNGGEGDFIKYVETFDAGVLDDQLKGPEFKLPSALDLGLRDIVVRLADLAGAAYAVRAFADHFSEIEFGRVNQALSCAFRVLHRLYLEHIAKLETRLAAAPEPCSLYTIWVHLESFAPYLTNARALIARFMEETRLARERKRHHTALNLVERASMANFVDHDEKEAVIELRGGAVLQSIAQVQRREMGDSRASNLYEELLAAASRPYLQMLERWLGRGELDDPFEEFLIQETQAFNVNAGSFHENLDDYWDKRFSVRTLVLPLQLSSPEIYNALLVSGKYLNVIRDSERQSALASPEEIGLGGASEDKEEEDRGRDGGNELSSNAAPSLDIDQCRSVEDPKLVEAVITAYKFANQRLLSILNGGSVYNLKALLAKLREVFFHHNSELFERFDASAKHELSKLANTVALEDLEHALALVKDAEDPWAKFIGLSLSPEPLRDALISVVAHADSYGDVGYTKDQSAARHADTKMTGYDAVQFDFTVPFPLNLVASRRSIMRYQYLFRHIVDLKLAQKALEATWVDQVKDRRRSSAKVQRLSDSMQLCLQNVDHLRERMQQLMTDLLHHSTVDGILQESTAFYESLDSFTEVSELVDAHIRSLDRSLMACFLSDAQLLKIQSRLITLCKQFASFFETNADAVAYVLNPEETALLTDEKGEDILRDDVELWLMQALSRYDSAFHRNVKKFRDSLASFMPNNFVAGASTLYLIHRLEPFIID